MKLSNLKLTQVTHAFLVKPDHKWTALGQAEYRKNAIKLSE